MSLKQVAARKLCVASEGGVQEPYQWYVIYVRTESEKRVVDELNRFIAERKPDGEYEPFCPESESYYRNSREKQLGKTYRKRPLFPGYVFVQTTAQPAEFLNAFGDYLYSSSDVIRLLRMSGARESIAMPTDERKRLEFLLMNKRCLEHSVGYIVGDRVCVQSGPLKNHEGLIKYINRHNRFAEIEVEMFGGTVKARVALEIVEKR